MTTTKKKPDNRTYTQKRRLEAREALRDKFKGVEYIRQIEESYQELCKLDRTVVEAKNTKQAPFHIQQTLDKAETRHKIIKTKIDTNFRRLAKVLPDLKSVELTDPNGNNPLSTLIEVFRDAVVNHED